MSCSTTAICTAVQYRSRHNPQADAGVFYCAPEQTKDARQADIRSDIYSLGCVLYHALAGQPPFEDQGPVRLMLSHATEPPPRLASLNLDVPAGLQAVLDKMLAKDPAFRFPIPEQAAEALRQFLAPK